MRIGNNEKILLSIIKKNPNLSENALHLLFRLTTQKKLRLWRTIDTLRAKGLLEPDKFVLKENNLELPNIHIEGDILDKQIILNKNLRLGRKEKKVLYILSKIKRSSFQFLVTCSAESVENLFPVLQRLEESGLIYNYYSPIRHRNVKGRWYKPKYYGITEIGKVVSKIKLKNFVCDKNTQQVLAETESDIETLKTDFHGTLNID